MPVQKDKARAQLVNIMAKRSSVAATEALLERAVRFRDSKKIETATSILQNILSTTKQNSDSYPHLRPKPCKPGDCQRCFWRSWCEMKESFDLSDEARRVIEKSRRMLKL